MSELPTCINRIICLSLYPSEGQLLFITNLLPYSDNKPVSLGNQCAYMYIHVKVASLPGTEEGGGERASGIHCLRMRLIAMEFHGDRVHMYTYVYCTW